MRCSKIRAGLILLCGLSLASGCGSGEGRYLPLQTLPPSPGATPTSSPSETPLPTPTPSPSDTPTPPAVSLVSLSVTPTSLSLPRGQSQQLQAIGRYSDGSERDLTAEVTWTSSLPDQIEVSSAGVVLALAAPGVATVSAVQNGISSDSSVRVAQIAYSCGQNQFRQLGNGSRSNSVGRPAEVRVPSGVRFIDVIAGTNHSLALSEDGRAWGWGLNVQGQLGNGESGLNANRSTPVEVVPPAGVLFTSMAAGSNHSLAVGDDGRAYSWGFNRYGQLGDLNAGDISVSLPSLVSLPTGVFCTAVAAGEEHSLALGGDGKLYTWGNNSEGQLGNGARTDSDSPPYNLSPSPIPTAISSPPAGVTFTSISAGYRFSLALGNNGKLYTWGDNFYGQLGNGTNTDALTPVAVTNPPGVSFVAASVGFHHCLALGDDGQVYAWGLNFQGQLGQSSSGAGTNSNLPVRVPLPTGTVVRNVIAGNFHSHALSADGQLYAWGEGVWGQMGNGSFASLSTPISVPLPTGLAGFSGASAANHVILLGY